MAKEAGYVLVDVSAAHAAAVDSVDLDHADPFDRLILAQALTEPMRLVTRDAKLAAYGDNVITW